MSNTMSNKLITPIQIESIIDEITSDVINFNCDARNSSVNSSRNNTEHSSYTGHSTNNSTVKSSNGNGSYCAPFG